MTKTRNSDAQTAKARGDVYGLLATLFRAEPSPELLGQMRSADFARALADLGASAEQMFPDAAQSNADMAALLAEEYTWLFIGPGSRLSPHESIHVEIDGAVGGFWGARTVAAKKFIEATGLDYSNDFSGMPDHISAELELMQKLAEREVEAWQDGEAADAQWCRDVARRFLDDHLLCWVPDFCVKVADKTRHPFYAQVAHMTKAFLEFEDEQLPTKPAPVPTGKTARNGDSAPRRQQA